MNKEEKELLNKLLCAMFPYGVICSVVHKKDGRLVEEDMKLSGMFEDGNFYFTDEMGSTYSDNYIPYLRPLESMTEEERAEYFLLKHRDKDRVDNIFLIDEAFALINWINKKCFDYRGLIEKELALEAPEGMYN